MMPPSHRMPGQQQLYMEQQDHNHGIVNQMKNVNMSGFNQPPSFQQHQQPIPKKNERKLPFFVIHLFLLLSNP